MSTMQEILKKFGFLDVTNTLSFSGCKMLERATMEDVIVPQPENAFRFDANNGVTAFWDDKGHPWIRRRGREVKGDVLAELLMIVPAMRVGVEVPHSNDSGLVARFFFPTEEGAAPNLWDVVVGLQSYRVSSPVAAQMLFLTKILEQKSHLEQALHFKKTAAMVEDGKISAQAGWEEILSK